MVDELSNLKHDQQVYFEMESLTSLTTLIIIRYHNFINTLVDLITDVRHGKPHPAKVTPGRLETILTTIRKEIFPDLRLPTLLNHNSLFPLYQVSTMSTTIHQERIIFELNIPLPYRQAYQLYKVHPLPTIYLNKFVFIKPEINYLVVDYSREHFYDMTSNELSNCVTLDHSQFICRELHPFFSATFSGYQCEIQLLRKEILHPAACEVKYTNLTTVWIQLSQTNKWLFSTLENYTVDEICYDQITTYTLSQAGILELPSECYLRTRDLTIRGHNIKTSEVKNSYVPPVKISNLLTNISRAPAAIPELTIIKYSPDNDLSSLASKIKEIKAAEQTPLKALDVHNVHHYSLAYGIISLLILVTLYKNTDKFRGIFKGCAKTRESDPQKESQGEDESNRSPFVLTCGKPS